jgi:parallel beta-helix repeat protein
MPDDFEVSLRYVDALIDALKGRLPSRGIVVEGDENTVINNTVKGYDIGIAVKGVANTIANNDVYANDRPEILKEVDELRDSLKNKSAQGARTKYEWFKRNAVPIATFLGTIVEFMRIIQGH